MAGFVDYLRMLLGWQSKTTAASAVGGPYWVEYAYAFMAGPTGVHAFRGGNTDHPPAHAYGAGPDQLKCEPMR